MDTIEKISKLIDEECLERHRKMFDVEVEIISIIKAKIKTYEILSTCTELGDQICYEYKAIRRELETIFDLYTNDERRKWYYDLLCKRKDNE